jgi:hypothetical protein
MLFPLSTSLMLKHNSRETQQTYEWHLLMETLIKEALINSLLPNQSD